MSTFHDTINTSDSSEFDEDVDAADAILMEKIVAARIEQHKADQRLAEQLHAQQLQEQIQRLQAQLRYQESMATASTIGELPHQESQRPGLLNSTTTGTFAPNLSFFNGRTSSSILAEQESLMVLGKAVAQRARQQAQNQQEESCTKFDDPETSKESSKLPQCSKKELQYYPTKPNQPSLQQPELLSEEDIQRMTNTPALAKQGRLSYPGAIRVGNNTEDDEDDNLQYQVSTVVLDDNDNTDDEPIIAGIHTDLEKAQVRQEIIQQAPQVDVVAVKEGNDQGVTERFDDSRGDNNKTKRLFGITLLFVLIAVTIVVVIVLVLRSTEQQLEEPTSPPTPTPTASTTCPCTFDTSTFQTTGMAEPYGIVEQFPLCGRYGPQEETLTEGQFGAGMCLGKDCLRFLPGVASDLVHVGCFLYRRRTAFLELSTNAESAAHLIQNDAQEQDCLRLLNEKCIEQDWEGSPPP